MTMPPSGNGPFDYTEDTVSARLSVEVPADAIANLQQVTRQANDLRTVMEAVARAQADFAEYLRQLPELMADAATAAERLTSGTTGLLGGPTTGAAAVRSGRNDATATNWDEDAPGGRDTDRVVDLDSAMDDLARRDPRQYGNVLAQHGERVIRRGDSEEALPAPRQRRPRSGGAGPGRTGPSPQDAQPTDWTQSLQRYSGQGTNVVNSILNDTQAGGRSSFLDMGQHAVRGGISGYRNVQGRMAARIAELQAESAAHTIAGNAPEAIAAEGQAARLGSMSSGLGMAAKGAGVVGVGLAAAQAVQSGGQWYQGMSTQGMQRGGGFSEGMGYEMQVRTMALNPFISLEQSRKIMQSALNEGYTGKEFDTVTEFMADNLKKMNVDVATSVKVLQENVQKGGQSIGSAQTDIGTAQQLSADPNSKLTAGQSVAAYTANTTAAIGVGASGVDASKYGLTTAALGDESQILKGVLGTGLVGAATSNPIVQQAIGASVGFRGAPGGALAYALAQPGGAQKAEQAQVDQMIAMAQNFLPMLANPQTAGAAVTGYQQVLGSMGYNFDIPTVQEILKEIMNGTFKALPTKAAEAVKTSATGGDIAGPSGAERTKQVSRGVGGFFQEIGGAAAWALGAGGHNPLADLGRGMMGAGQRNVEQGSALSGSASTNSRIVDLVNTYGASGQVMLKGKDGKEMKLDANALSNESVVQDIVSGDTQVKLPGGDYSKLENISTAQQTASGTGGGVIGLTDEARRYFNFTPNDPRNLTQIGNDTGTNGVQRLNPIPGTNYGN